MGNKQFEFCCGRTDINQLKCRECYIDGNLRILALRGQNWGENYHKSSTHDSSYGNLVRSRIVNIPPAAVVVAPFQQANGWNYAAANSFFSARSSEREGMPGAANGGPRYYHPESGVPLRNGRVTQARGDFNYSQISRFQQQNGAQLRTSQVNAH